MRFHDFDVRRARLVRSALLSVLAAALFLALAGVTVAQGLRFGNHREIKPPDYALLRIGPFYSSLLFQQTAGYRYVRTRGTGTDFLMTNRRGEIRDDGHELPLVTTLNMRNYLLISRNMDLDASFRIIYQYYPLDTQEDEFIFDPAAEGIEGNFSSEFELTPFIRGFAYERMVYRTDYVDARGYSDRYGGSEYEYFNNQAGLKFDWLMLQKHNLGLNLIREDNFPRSDGFEEQEYASSRASLVYQYRLFPGVVVGVMGQQTHFDYAATNRADVDQTDFTGIFNLTQEKEAGLELTRSTKLNGEVGLTQVNTEPIGSDRTDQDTTEVTGELSLETKLTRGLSHSVTLRREVRRGFLSAAETSETLRYQMLWNDGYMTASAYSGLGRADPSDLDVSDYDTWTSGIEIVYPLTRIVKLNLMTQYIRRGVEALPEDVDTDDMEPELLYDYNTWISRVGTSFALTRKVGFSTYYQHVERDSDYGDLAYKRDIFAANCSFSHQF
jgi:hypothetical protein